MPNGATTAGRELALRQTPRGRLFERRCLSWDCNILTVGVLGLAFQSFRLLLFASIGHIIVGIIVAPRKLAYLQISVLLTAFSTAIFVAISYALYIFGLYNNVSLVYLEWIANLGNFSEVTLTKTFWDYESNNLLLSVLIALIFNGIAGALFGYPGCADELIDFKNRADADKQIIQ